MTSLFRTFSRAVTCAGLAALGWSVVAQAQGPTVFNACVTPLTGLLYQPKEAGKCFLPSHQPIKWTDALGAILSGSVANGDLDGTYPNPKVDGLRGRPVADVAPTTNQILAWNGTAWAPKDPTGGASGTAGGALTGTYPNPALAEGVVTTPSLANGSVTEPKLAFNPATQEELEAASATAAAAAAAATLQNNINAVNDAIAAYKALLSNSGGTANTAGNPVSWTSLETSRLGSSPVAARVVLRVETSRELIQLRPWPSSRIPRSQLRLPRAGRCWRSTVWSGSRPRPPLARVVFRDGRKLPPLTELLPEQLPVCCQRPVLQGRRFSEVDTPIPRTWRPCSAFPARMARSGTSPSLTTTTILTTQYTSSQYAPTLHRSRQRRFRGLS